jgi:hypothetical protein
MSDIVDELRTISNDIAALHDTDNVVRKAADELARLRAEDAAWWALVMGAAAALEDAANCLSDADAKRAAEGAAKHYRTEAATLWRGAIDAARKEEPQ